MGYQNKAITGFGWQSVLKVVSNLIALLKIFILARLLAPNDFGLFSLTMIALGLSEALTQTGINLTIIQSKHSIRYFINTAWVIAIFRGFIIGIVMTLLGLGMGEYFDNQQLTILITLAALVPIIKGFINPAIVTLQKDLKFFNDTLYRLSLVIVETIFAILITLVVKSAFALIWAIILAAIFEVIISFIFFKDKPAFNFLPNRAKLIFSNAKWLSLASVFNYLNENIDDFILGKLVGTYNLGIYHNAYSLSHKANYELSKSVHHSTMPIYTKIVKEKDRLRKAFMKTITVTFLIGFSVSLPIFIFPKLFVTIILGQKWLEAIPLIRPLLIAGLIQSISMASYTLFLSKKKYQYLNTHLATTLLLSVGLMISLGKIYGLIGAVIGIGIARLLTLPIIIYAVKKIFSK